MAKALKALYAVRNMERMARASGNAKLAAMLKAERAAVTSEIFFG